MTRQETKRVKRYSVDIYADGSDVELMTRTELIHFAQEQVLEWWGETMLIINHDESKNLKEKHKEAIKLVDKIINHNYQIKSIKEVEKLFKLPAITIPFEVIYV